MFNKMSQFILVDPSIEGLGGHYFAYADSILRVIPEYEMEPQLFTNQKFRCEPGIPYPVTPLFRNTFWEGLAHYYIKQDLGLSGGKSARDLYRLGKWALYGKAQTEKKRDAFHEDIVRGLGIVSASGADQVFMPTTSPVELEAICNIVETEINLPKRWHLLFRRDADSFAAANSNVWKLFSRTKDNSKGIDVRFYSDTEQLSAEYSLRSNCQFQTLPIPHTGGKIKEFDRESFTVSYLGDMRKEKGYQHLPYILKMLQEKYPDFEKINFFIQSNPASAAEKEAIDAAKEIESMHLCNVTQVYEPLSEEEYRGRLAASDLILLPYDASAYKNRSSGIFAEAIALGIPVIVPDGTWMSSQMKRDCDNQTISIFFSDKEELVMLIIKTLANYKELKKEAVLISGGWRNYHNANKLVEILNN